MRLFRFILLRDAEFFFAIFLPADLSILLWNSLKNFFASSELLLSNASNTFFLIVLHSDLIDLLYSFLVSLWRTRFFADNEFATSFAPIRGLVKLQCQVYTWMV